MDIEIVREMITMLEQVGESTKELCIWWIILQYLPTIIFGTCWSCISIWVLKIAKDIIINYLASERLRKAAGVSCFWGRSELNSAIKILEKHKYGK